MKEYLFTLSVASVIGGIASLLAKSGSFEKYIRFIAALICVTLMLSPFVALKSVDFSQLGNDISEAAEAAEASAAEAVAEAARPAIAEYISQKVFDKFGIKLIAAGISLDETGTGRILLTVAGADESIVGEVCIFTEELTGIQTEWVAE